MYEVFCCIWCDRGNNPCPTACAASRLSVSCMPHWLWRPTGIVRARARAWEYPMVQNHDIGEKNRYGVRDLIDIHTSFGYFRRTALEDLALFPILAILFAGRRGGFASFGGPRPGWLFVLRRVLQNSAMGGWRSRDRRGLELSQQIRGQVENSIQQGGGIKVS